MKKSTAVLLLLAFLTVHAFAQKQLAAYPLKGKPSFEIKYVDPWPAKTMYYMRYDQPCTIEAHTTVAGKELDIVRYEVSLEGDQGTVDTVPGHPNQFIITPRPTATRGNLRISFHATTPGYRLMNPVAKAGFEHVYGSDGLVIPEAIGGWEAIPNVDANGRFLMDAIVMRVVNPKK